MTACTVAECLHSRPVGRTRPRHSDTERRTPRGRPPTDPQEDLRTMPYQDALTSVIDDVVAPNATVTDTTADIPPRQHRRPRRRRHPRRVLGHRGGWRWSGPPGRAPRSWRASRPACASTAMVVTMHYSATAAIEAHGPEAVRGEIAAGNHLSTLAFSETGSRSHFWAPVGTATAAGDAVRLDAAKSWVTSAGEADSYVWSSRPVAADGPMTLWFVPARHARPVHRGRLRRPRPPRQRLVPGAGRRRDRPRRRPARRRRRRPRHRARRRAAVVPALLRRR